MAAIAVVSALGADANEGRHRLEVGGRPVVLGMPLGARAAHIVELGPVSVEQASGQVLEEVGEVGGQALGLAAVGRPANWLSHDPLRSASCCRIWFAGSGSLRASSHEATGYATNYRTKFVKNQYEFACDFKIVGHRC
jgi:hypothetical protein